MFHNNHSSHFSTRRLDMKILPVLDIMGGQVVRGVAGRRAEYRPVVSQLISSAEPLAIARAFRERWAFAEIYLADLDAIAGQPPALATMASLLQAGFSLWVDAGIQQPTDALPLFETGVQTVIAGLESVAGPNAIRELCRTHSPERIVFSLDLNAGVPLACSSQWTRPAPLDIAADAIAAGIQRLLVLDLSRVGVGQGPGTETLCHTLVTTYPTVRIAAGGGVRGPDDLRRMRDAGVSTVLLASCLHDGQFDSTWLV